MMLQLTECHDSATECHNAATECNDAATERQVPTGELDLMEWLPAFGNPTSLGATTGFHNAVSGACVFNRTHLFCLLLVSVSLPLPPSASDENLSMYTIVQCLIL